MKNSGDFVDIEDRILKEAKNVFIKKGLDSSSMAEIAKNVGITRTSLNYYFRTKERLFLKIYQDIVLQFLPSVEKVVLSGKPIFKRIEEATEIYTQVFLENPDIILFIANESAKNPERYFSFIKSFPEIERSARRIGAEIKCAMKENKLREVPLEYFVTTFFGLLFFPFLGRNILSGVFFKNDANLFKNFILERRKFVSQSMKSIFKPTRR